MVKSSKNATKSSKNKKKQSSRSLSPQANAPMQRTPNAPNGPNRRTRVAKAITVGVTGVQQLVSSGSKALTGRQTRIKVRMLRSNKSMRPQ